MRLGINTLVRHPERPDQWIDVETMIDLAVRLGLDLIDVQLDRGFKSLEKPYLKSIASRCRDLGIDIGYAGVGTGFVGRRLIDKQVIGDALSPTELEERIRDVERGIDAAAALGTPLVRLFAGAVPDVTPDREAVWAGAVDAFRRVADYAARSDIRIGLHNHPPTVAPTGDDILRLLDEIDRPNVTVILDTGQWHGSPGTNLEGRTDPRVDFYRSIQQVAPCAHYVRAKIYRIDSGTEQWLDYDRIFDILAASGYDGPVSVVYEDRGNRCTYDEAIELAVDHLRSFLT